MNPMNTSRSSAASSPQLWQDKLRYYSSRIDSGRNTVRGGRPWRSPPRTRADAYQPNAEHHRSRHSPRQLTGGHDSNTSWSHLGEPSSLSSASPYRAHHTRDGWWGKEFNANLRQGRAHWLNDTHTSRSPVKAASARSTPPPTPHHLSIYSVHHNSGGLSAWEADSTPYRHRRATPQPLLSPKRSSSRSSSSSSHKRDAGPLSERSDEGWNDVPERLSDTQRTPRRTPPRRTGLTSPPSPEVVSPVRDDPREHLDDGQSPRPLHHSNGNSNDEERNDELRRHRRSPPLIPQTEPTLPPRRSRGNRRGSPPTVGWLSVFLAALGTPSRGRTQCSPSATDAEEQRWIAAAGAASDTTAPAVAAAPATSEEKSRGGYAGLVEVGSSARLEHLHVLALEDQLHEWRRRALDAVHSAGQREAELREVHAAQVAELRLTVESRMHELASRLHTLEETRVAQGGDWLSAAPPPSSGGTLGNKDREHARTRPTSTCATPEDRTARPAAAYVQQPPNTKGYLEGSTAMPGELWQVHRAATVDQVGPSSSGEWTTWVQGKANTPTTGPSGSRTREPPVSNATHTLPGSPPRRDQPTERGGSSHHPASTVSALVSGPWAGKTVSAVGRDPSSTSCADDRERTTVAQGEEHAVRQQRPHAVHDRGDRASPTREPSPLPQRAAVGKDAVTRAAGSQSVRASSPDGKASPAATLVPVVGPGSDVLTSASGGCGDGDGGGALRAQPRAGAGARAHAEAVVARAAAAVAHASPAPPRREDPAAVMDRLQRVLRAAAELEQTNARLLQTIRAQSSTLEVLERSRFEDSVRRQSERLRAELAALATPTPSVTAATPAAAVGLHPAGIDAACPVCGSPPLPRHGHVERRQWQSSLEASHRLPSAYGGADLSAVDTPAGGGGAQGVGSTAPTRQWRSPTGASIGQECYLARGRVVELTGDPRDVMWGVHDPLQGGEQVGPQGYRAEGSSHHPRHHGDGGTVLHSAVYDSWDTAPMRRAPHATGAGARWGEAHLVVPQPSAVEVDSPSPAAAALVSSPEARAILRSLHQRGERLAQERGPQAEGWEASPQSLRPDGVGPSRADREQCTQQQLSRSPPRQAAANTAAAGETVSAQGSPAPPSPSALLDPAWESIHSFERKFSFLFQDAEMGPTD